MSEQRNHVSAASPQVNAQTPRRRARRWLLIATVALGAAFTGALATRAIGEYGFGPGPWHGRGLINAPLDSAQAEDRADRMVRHLAIEIDATTEQQEKLRTVAKAAIKDLFPMREKLQAARQRAHALLTQPSIDRAAIEALRAEQMALADAASRRLAQAIGDAAEVLTAEQRRKIDDHLKWRRSHWRGWHRG
jgi:protein CpxP